MADNALIRKYVPDWAIKELAEGLQLVGESIAVQVSDDIDYDRAAAVLRTIRKARRRLDEQRTAITRQWSDPKKVIDDHYRPVTEALKAADERFANAIGNYYGKQVSSSQRFEEKAMGVADDRRERLLSTAEKEAKRADVLAASGSIDKSLAAVHKASVAVESASEIVAPITEPRKPLGIGFTMKPVAELKDLDKAVAFCMARHELRKCVVIDLAALEEVHRKSHGNQKVDGVEFVETYRPIVQGDA